ncbi:MAG: nifB: nitrogenase cofactor biosynthesis protein NifB [Firmicutes bacterium]|nr:nifB: nitrogenase cofactor biosynthesis protein NifB [Bacillota bacterium]
MAKVAVASMDGISVNEHFGRVKDFYVYEVSESGEYTLLDRRRVVREGGKNVPHTMEEIVLLLTGVEAVLAAQIGPHAEQELRGNGIIALSVTGPIEKTLQMYGKRSKYIS